MNGEKENDIFSGTGRPVDFHEFLKSTGSIEVAVPCRIDMGGTLDISTLFYPLRHLHPCTVNLAIRLPTTVRLTPYRKGIIKVSSRGFESAEFPLDHAPYDHPLGLVFAIAAFFRSGGIHIEIRSTSPPRGALGGSSSVGVGVIGALSAVVHRLGGRKMSRREIALLAHGIESSVARIPCGIQDQLAAAYGGINLWHWLSKVPGPVFRRKTILPKSSYRKLEKCILLAYCGRPHASKKINGIWIDQFLNGKFKNHWLEIIKLTERFAEALMKGHLKGAVEAVSEEVALRRQMTPDVFDGLGDKLVRSAETENCGARFTGAGGGGCIWALGEAGDIQRLAARWKDLLTERKTAELLPVEIDGKGLRIKD